MDVGAAVAAADAGEGGNGVPVAVTVTEERHREKEHLTVNNTDIKKGHRRVCMFLTTDSTCRSLCY